MQSLRDTHHTRKLCKSVLLFAAVYIPSNTLFSSSGVMRLVAVL